jgi:hypothetical protein
MSGLGAHWRRWDSLGARQISAMPPASALPYVFDLADASMRPRYVWSRSKSLWEARP